MEKSFRLLDQSDNEQYFDVLSKGYQSIKNLPISFDAVDTNRKETAKWLSNHPTYGLIVGEQLVSVVSLRMPWGDSPGPLGYPHLGRFSTHPEHKRKGYARQLFEKVEQEVLSNQLKTPYVTLGTAENHDWLKEMYEAFGFEVWKTVQLEGKQHRTVYLKKKVSKNQK